MPNDMFIDRIELTAGELCDLKLLRQEICEERRKVDVRFRGSRACDAERYLALLDRILAAVQ